MTDRFVAEEILRAAASGALPSEGDFLVRTAEGWKFGVGTEGDLDITFDDIDGVVDSVNIPDPLLVNEIKERTVNVGTKVEDVLHLNGVAPDLEARARFSRR